MTTARSAACCWAEPVLCTRRSLIIALLLALAINATASGTLIAGHFGYPPASAVVVFLLAVVALTFFGRRIVEASMVLAFAALILVLAVLVGIVAAEHRGAVIASFAEPSREVEGIGAGLSVALATGGHFPLLLYCGRGLRTRREAGVAAICAGFCGIVPPSSFTCASCCCIRRSSTTSCRRIG